MVGGVNTSGTQHEASGVHHLYRACPSPTGAWGRRGSDPCRHTRTPCEAGESNPRACSGTTLPLSECLNHLPDRAPVLPAVVSKKERQVRVEASAVDVQQHLALPPVHPEHQHEPRDAPGRRASDAPGASVPPEVDLAPRQSSTPSKNPRTRGPCPRGRERRMELARIHPFLFPHTNVSRCEERSLISQSHIAVSSRI